MLALIFATVAIDAGVRHLMVVGSKSYWHASEVRLLCGRRRSWLPDDDINGVVEERSI
jgi:hypothetical protein